MSLSVFLLSLAEGFLVIGLLWAFALEFVDPKSMFAVFVITNIAFGATFTLAYRDEGRAMEENDG